jgi:hypothetical protein
MGNPDLPLLWALSDHWPESQNNPSGTSRSRGEPQQMTRHPCWIDVGLRLDGRDCGGLGGWQSHPIHVGNNQPLLPS